MRYKVFNNKTQLKTRSAKVFPAPYNDIMYMEYVIFTVDGKSNIEIEADEAICSAVIRPRGKIEDFTISDNKLYFTLDRPTKISVEINGNKNLMLFADGISKRAIRSFENKIIIKKDEEYRGTLEIDKDNTLVYIEDGGVIKGNIRANGRRNLMICGRGRICMTDYTYEMRKYFAHSIDITDCKHVRIYDIIIDDSNDWSMRINGCSDVNIDNVKIFGCRGNSDGIDICGSKNVVVNDIFTRVWDDSLVVKSLGTGDCENVIFKNSVLWNDFARPMEVGVELRADRIRNIVFDNIDVIHSASGYPVMGIHHGDHAVVSDITFKNIRIDDAPGAQLFDIRIADSVWSRDTKMGNIRDILFKNIRYIGEDDIQLSDSRLEGFSREHNIENVTFENIIINGRTAVDKKSLGIDIYDNVKGVNIIPAPNCDPANRLDCIIEESKAFTYDPKTGRYKGKISVTLINQSNIQSYGEALLAISPKNTAEVKTLNYKLAAGEASIYELEYELLPGKYVFFIKHKNNCVCNSFLYKQFDFFAERDIDSAARLEFVNYYGMRNAAVKIAVRDDNLIIKNAYGIDTHFMLYTAMPAKIREGEIIFSTEETDFGEVCAYVNRNGRLISAPQLRNPLEITYVFKNEPKVKEIVKNKIFIKSGECIALPFERLGIDSGSHQFLMDLAAQTEGSEELRYEYTLFHSVMPEKTAHMFGRINCKG